MHFMPCEDLDFSAWPISAQCCILYRNQSFDFHCKSNDWFLYGMPHLAEMCQCLGFDTLHWLMFFFLLFTYIIVVNLCRKHLSQFCQRNTFYMCGGILNKRDRDCIVRFSITIWFENISNTRCTFINTASNMLTFYG